MTIVRAPRSTQPNPTQPNPPTTPPPRYDSDGPLYGKGDFLGECTVATPTLLLPNEDPATALTITLPLVAGEKELDGTLSEKKLKLVKGTLTLAVARVPDVRRAPQTGRPGTGAVAQGAEEAVNDVSADGDAVDAEGEKTKGKQEEGAAGVAEGGASSQASGAAVAAVPGAAEFPTASPDAAPPSKPTSVTTPKPAAAQRPAEVEEGNLFGGCITLRLDLHDAPDPVHEFWEETDDTPKAAALLMGEVAGAVYGSTLHALDDDELARQIEEAVREDIEVHDVGHLHDHGVASEVGTAATPLQAPLAPYTPAAAAVRTQTAPTLYSSLGDGQGYSQGYAQAQVVGPR